MIFPNLEQFTELAQQGNFVPVYQELVADLETPVSAWYKAVSYTHLTLPTNGW
jgi:anthranilate synthase component 1